MEYHVSRASLARAMARLQGHDRYVIAPLEEAINGVENMTYMTSTATNTGSASIIAFLAILVARFTDRIEVSFVSFAIFPARYAI